MTSSKAEMRKRCAYRSRAFSHDVTAAILAFQNNEMAATLVYQTNPVGVCSNNVVCLQAT